VGQVTNIQELNISQYSISARSLPVYRVIANNFQSQRLGRMLLNHVASAQSRTQAHTLARTVFFFLGGGMSFYQKLSFQCICVGSFIFASNKDSSRLIVLLSHHFHTHSARQSAGICHAVGRTFFTHVDISPCSLHFHLAISFKICGRQQFALDGPGIEYR
jgi:hypothetical protein